MLLRSARTCAGTSQHSSTDTERRELHQLATTSASLLSQLVWDASGRRDVDSTLGYCRLASEHIDEADDHLAAAEIPLRQTFVALYSVGQPPRPSLAQATAESARSKGAAVSSVPGRTG
jgi:hypothetical protein